MLAGCTTAPDNGLDNAKARWAAAGVTSYELVIQRSCFCEDLGQVRVVVTDGVITSRTVLSTGQPLPAASADNYPDVPGLFAFVEDAFRHAASINASFDGQYGFPRQVVVDFIAAAVDDELTVNVSGFVER